jgi:hypothetical protein
MRRRAEYEQMLTTLPRLESTVIYYYLKNSRSEGGSLSPLRDRQAQPLPRSPSLLADNFSISRGIRSASI